MSGNLILNAGMALAGYAVGNNAKPEVAPEQFKSMTAESTFDYQNSFASSGVADIRTGDPYPLIAFTGKLLGNYVAAPAALMYFAVGFAADTAADCSGSIEVIDSTTGEVLHSEPVLIDPAIPGRGRAAISVSGIDVAFSVYFRASVGSHWESIPLDIIGYTVMDVESNDDPIMAV
jgi:hypothetical protein